MRKNQRNTIVTLLVLLMATALVGCASKKAAEETKKAETTAVKEEATEVAEVKEETAEPTSEPTPEPTSEPTHESTPEPIVYEGVDMNSTLPGEEWVRSLEGIVKEPKLVVFNDTTNKKIIVEEGQEVEFVADDVLSIHTPEDTTVVLADYDAFIYHQGNLVYTMKEVFPNVWANGSVVTKNVVKVNGEEMTLTATLVFVE